MPLSIQAQEKFIISAIEEKIDREAQPATLFSSDPSSSIDAEYSIFCDGGSRGNPGPAGAGWVIKHKDQTVFDGKKYLGNATNNQAEYNSLISALEDVKKVETESIQIFMDSELVVKQVRGEYKVKNLDLKPLHEKVHALLADFSSWSIEHIRREKNTEADKLANEAMDRKG